MRLKDVRIRAVEVLKEKLRVASASPAAGGCGVERHGDHGRLHGLPKVHWRDVPIHGNKWVALWLVTFFSCSGLRVDRLEFGFDCDSSAHCAPFVVAVCVICLMWPFVSSVQRLNWQTRRVILFQQTCHLFCSHRTPRAMHLCALCQQTFSKPANLTKHRSTFCGVRNGDDRCGVLGFCWSLVIQSCTSGTSRFTYTSSTFKEGEHQEGRRVHKLVLDNE